MEKFHENENVKAAVIHEFRYDLYNQTPAV